MSNEPMSNPIMATSSPYMYPTSPPWILMSSASTSNSSSSVTPSSYASSSRGDFIAINPIAINSNDSFSNDKIYGDKFDNKSMLNSGCTVQLPSSDHSTLVLRLRGGVSDDTPVRRTRNKVYSSQGPAQPLSLKSLHAQLSLEVSKRPIRLSNPSPQTLPQPLLHL